MKPSQLKKGDSVMCAVRHYVFVIAMRPGEYALSNAMNSGG
jgi:hypothetical protein